MAEADTLPSDCCKIRSTRSVAFCLSNSVMFSLSSLENCTFWEVAQDLFSGMEEGEYGISFPASVRTVLLLSVLVIEVLGKSYLQRGFFGFKMFEILFSR